MSKDIKNTQGGKVKLIIQEKKKKATASIDFVRCPIHGTNYPKGNSCPKCKI